MNPTSKYTVLEQMNAALADSEASHNRLHNWLIEFCYSDASEEERAELKARHNQPSIIGWIAGWGKAEEMKYFIEHLPAGERKKPENLVFKTGAGDVTFADLDDRMLSMEAAADFKSKDKDSGPILREILKEQLARALVDWESDLKEVKERGYDETEFGFIDSPDTLCDRRDELEYCIQGLERLQMRGILVDMRDDLRKFRNGVLHCDPYLEEALDGVRCPRVAADKAYWWRHEGAKPELTKFHKDRRRMESKGPSRMPKFTKTHKLTD